MPNVAQPIEPTANHEPPAVVCRLGDRLFAVSSTLVESMVQLPPVTRVPETPQYVRGVINLRGRILKVIDLRRRLGIQSLAEESKAFTDMLTQRLGEHRAWLDALRKSVETQTRFTGELDPTKCGFGRWYTEFETNDVVLRAVFQRFDKPHRAIHALGHEVSDMVRRGEHDAARDRIAKAEATELRVLEHLFATTAETYLRSRREIAIVLGRNGAETATVVDQVVAVEHLEEVDDSATENAAIAAGAESMISGISRRPRTENELVFTLCEHVVLEV
ncbi:MAG: chemotaxis protein CheW [Polyangiales bacterium]